MHKPDKTSEAVHCQPAPGGIFGAYSADTEQKRCRKDEQRSVFTLHKHPPGKYYHIRVKKQAEYDKIL